jgi:hypothetical protein
VYALSDFTGNPDPDQRHVTAIAPSFFHVSLTLRMGSPGQSA